MHAVSFDEWAPQAIGVIMQLFQRAALWAYESATEDILAISADPCHRVVGHRDFESTSCFAQRAGAIGDALGILHLTTMSQSPTRFSIRSVLRIFPPPDTEISAAQAYGVPRLRHPDGRPWIGLCMVTSIDGSTVVNGTSQALSGPADRDVLVGLRSFADVIVVGASTIRQEQYAIPSKPGQTVGVVTRSTNLDLETDLFRSGAGFLILPESTPVPNSAVRCIRAGQSSVDLALAMQQISGTFIQLEGGPRLNASMFAADLVDEINITISPQIVGGVGPRLVVGAPDLHRRFEVAHVIHDEGFVFLRYVRQTR